MAVRLLYTLFTGILFAVLVGVGIAALYPQPKYPEYPAGLSRPVPPKAGTSESAQLNQQQIEYDTKLQAFQPRIEQYNRNVSLIAIFFAVIMVVVGLAFAKQIQVIPDGLVLGGVGTLIYSIVRGFNAHDDMFRFVIVLVSLGVTLLIGYIKFVKTTK